MTLLPRPRVPAVVAAFASLALAACGGSDLGPDVPAQMAPTITTQPADVTADEGGSASFSVVASGTAPLAYQWKRGGAAVAGATGTSYAMSPLTAADDGARVSVEVSNGVGRVESRAAVVSVRSAPRIDGQPQSVSTLSAVPATFSVTAAGSDLAYQWRRNGVAIPGATRSSYSVGVPLAGDHGATYSVVVTNPLGSVTSGEATLSVDVGPALRPTSYGNVKGRNIPSVDQPGEGFVVARAVGDFFGAGSLDYFTATQIYAQSDPPDDAPRGAFNFWRRTGSSYALVDGAVTGDVGCVHPRKAAVADYNGDGRADVFLACHGYDYAPNFPGEPSYAILSQPGGGWVSSAVGQAGFYHNATALDVDGDGDIDVVATNNFANPAVFVFANDGNGGFTLRNDLLPFGGGGYFTVEAADVDGDGRTDLLVGGHEFESAPTAVLLRDPSGSFASSTPRILPPVANEGVILDFVVVDADRDGVNEIYTLRTSGGDGTFYESVTVQKVTWPDLTGTVLKSERGTPWVAFMMPLFENGAYRLVSDVTSRPLSLAVP